VNQFVSTVKATSIVYIIGVSELTFVAQQVNAIEVTNPVRTFIVLAFFYFIPCWGLSVLSRKIERDISARRKAANVPGKEIRI
jgi:polar amino acid transport system permease protein